MVLGDGLGGTFPIQAVLNLFVRDYAVAHLAIRTHVVEGQVPNAAFQESM